MIVGVTQLVGHSIQKEVSPFCVKVINKSLENIHWSTVGNRLSECCQLLRRLAMKLLYSLFHQRVYVRRWKFTNTRQLSLFYKLASDAWLHYTTGGISEQKRGHLHYSNTVANALSR